MPDFAYDASRRDDVAQVALRGDLDMGATFQLEPEIDRLLADGDVRALVLDLGGLRFLDSSGLGLLVATHQRIRDAQRGMSLVGVPAEIRRVFDVAGLGDVLPLSEAG